MTGTSIDEVAAGVYRICTPLDVIPGGFTVNSYLLADDEPLLFHTGYRKLFPVTLQAIGKVMQAENLRWIGGSHFEGDEFGALNDLLTAAPAATPFGAEIGVLTSLNDYASRPARGLADGAEFSIGSRQMKWLYTPHVPHGWDCGILFDLSTKTLFCGDLFTQPGAQDAARDRIGGAYQKRRNARDDGLLRGRDEHIGNLGAPGGSPSVAARLSTWERLQWRRRCAAPRTSRHDRKSERQNVCTTNCPHCLTGRLGACLWPAVPPRGARRSAQ